MDKTRNFQAYHQATLDSFNMRQDVEITKLPSELRKMTLRQLENVWGGSWAGTLQRIAREKWESREREREKQEEEERREREAAAAAHGKRQVETVVMARLADRPTRKRETATTPESSLGRGNKNGTSICAYAYTG